MGLSATNLKLSVKDSKAAHFIPMQQIFQAMNFICTKTLAKPLLTEIVKEIGFRIQKLRKQSTQFFYE